MHNGTQDYVGPAFADRSEGSERFFELSAFCSQFERSWARNGPKRAREVLKNISGGRIVLIVSW